MIRLEKIKSDLSYLLGMDFDKRPYDRTAIALTFMLIREYHDNGEVGKRDLQLAKMELFSNQLSFLKDQDKQTYVALRRPIKQNRKIDNFFGIRFEVNIAAILLKENVVFKKQESPDFSIDYQSNKVAIECTSTRIESKSEDRDHFQKIKSKLKDYSKKKYANLHTALFVDITPLFFNRVERGITHKLLPDVKELVQVVKLYNYGSMFFFIYIGQDNKFSPYFRRCDHPHISENLKSFLDTYFSFPSVPLGIASIVREG